MGDYRKICMLSGVPIRSGEKVKIYFLAATGTYKNNKTIFAGSCVHPWDAFKVVSGFSVDAINKGYNKFEIIKNIRSETVLNYINKYSKIKDITYDNIFKLISDGKIEMIGRNENSFLSAGFVFKDIYENAVSLMKKNFEIELKNGFERYLNSKKRMEEQLISEGDSLSMLDEIVPAEFGLIQQYIYGYKNPYVHIKKTIDSNYSEYDFFNDIIDDLYIMELMNLTGTFIMPSIVLNEDIPSKFKTWLLKKSLLKSMNQKIEDDEYLKFSDGLYTFNQILISDMDEYFEEIKENDKKIYEEFIDFKMKNKNNKKILILKEDIDKYHFFKNSLMKTNKDIIVIFK